MRISLEQKWYIGAVLAVAFFWSGILSPLSMVGMTHHHETAGGMTDCPFMIGEAALCSMTPFDHLTSWQATFAAQPAELLAVILLLLALALSWRWLRQLFDPPGIGERQVFSYRGNPHITSFKNLLLGSSISPRAP